METKKIVLTGGHAATTALAVVEELIRRNQGEITWDIYWIGSERAIEGKDFPTLESQIFPKIGVTYHPIITGRLQRNFTLWTIPSLIRIPFGFFDAARILSKIKPDIILSFGGYAAFPVVVIGWVMNIPVVIHDQTSAYGRSNKLSAPFAKKIALARMDSVRYFNEKKAEVIGNPILTQIAEIEAKSAPGHPATIYITCGSRGSTFINGIITKIAKNLLNNYILIHQTGFSDFEKVKKIRDSLPEKLRNNYEIYPIIDPMQVDGVYKRSDIIIARAGANTVSEIISVKRPAILIPLSIAYQDEQLKNARIAEKLGIAQILEEKEITPEKLLNKIKEIDKNWKKIVCLAKGGNVDDRYASKKLVDILEKLC